MTTTPYIGHQTPPEWLIRKVNHARSFQMMSDLSATGHEWIWKREPAIKPEQVISVLNEAEVSFVLMGLYGLSGWLVEVRATQDVDVLVRKRQHRKAIKAIEAAFPHLELRDTEVVTRFVDPATDKVVLDLMKPIHELHQATFEHTVPVGETHYIPNLEMAMACKFAAMVSEHRERSKKFQDAADIASIVKRNHEKIDRKKLREFGELVYPGGGKEIIDLLNNMIEDKPIQL